jgi:hypothetical protein
MNGGTRAVGVLSSEQVESVLTAAAAAPSLYGSKPWTLRCRTGFLEVHADRARGLSSADPDQRQMWLACGAVLLNLRIAIRALGVSAVVHLVVDPATPDFVATVSPQESAAAAPSDLALFDVMPLVYDGAAPATRDRAPFLRLPVAESARNALRGAARVEQGWLASIGRRQLPALLLLALQAQHTQETQLAFAAEWNQWGTPNGAAAERGKSSDQAPDALFAVIGTFHDHPAARLQAGQAMQRVLLTAATLGLSAAFNSELVEVPAARLRLREMVGGGLWPHTVLRLGYRSLPAVS